MFQPMDFRLVTRADVAQIFGVCVKTVDNYIEQGLIPKPVSFASKEYWHPDDIRAFIDDTFRRGATKSHSVRSSAAESSTNGDIAAPLVSGGNPKAVLLHQRKHPTLKAKARQDAVLRQLNSGG